MNVEQAYQMYVEAYIDARKRFIEAMSSETVTDDEWAKVLAGEINAWNNMKEAEFGLGE